jgi:hypothetical protein
MGFDQGAVNGRPGEGENVVHHSLLVDDRAVLIERDGQGRIPRGLGPAEE